VTVENECGNNFFFLRESAIAFRGIMVLMIIG